MIEKIIRIAIAVAICAVILLLMKLLYKKISKKKTGLHIKFGNSLLNVIFIVICIFYCLSLFEETKGISSTIMKSSALLLAIATFAAQQALGNVFSGIFLSVSRPYDIGEKIKVMNMNNANVLADGVVTDITIRHTVIRTFDGQSAIIPNSVMDASVIMNANYNEKCGNIVEIVIKKDADVDLAMRILKKIIRDDNLTLNQESTDVTLSRICEEGIVIKGTVWTKTVDENFKACSNIRREILKRFKEENIEI